MKKYHKRSEVKKMAEDAVSEVLKEKGVIDKLFYWVIFKVSYHVGFIYQLIKAIITRKW